MALLSLTSAGSAFSAGLPKQAAPEGFRLTDNAGGGRILDGPLPGVKSADEAFHVGLRRLHSCFGDTLEVTGAVRSKDDKTTTAFFRASLYGVSVTGLSIIAFAPDNGSREAILFDTPTNFGKSVSSMTARLKGMPLPAGRPSHRGSDDGDQAAIAIPPLHPVRAQDGTVGISIPADWQVAGLGDGRVVVHGPNNEFVMLNRQMVFLDSNSQRARNALSTAKMTGTRVVTPVPIATYSSDVGEAYVSGCEAFAQSNGQPDPHVHVDYVKPIRSGTAVLMGTRTDGGVEYKFLGTVVAAPSAMGSWILTMWQMSATKDEFARVGPVMMAIEKSLTYNAQADREKKKRDTDEVIAMSKAAMETSKKSHEGSMEVMQRGTDSSMAAARASQDSIDRSAAGMIHVIYGTSVLERTATGAHGTFDSETAQLVAQQDPEHYRVVSMNEYRKGVDY